MSTTAVSILQEEVGRKARFEPFRDFVLQYIGRFNATVLPNLKESMDVALEKLCAMSDDNFEALLKTYQYVRGHLTTGQATNGLGELWRLLTLIQLAYPNWRHVDLKHYANIEIKEDDLIHIIYSINQDTMPEIILDLAERNLQSDMRSIFKRLGFPKRIILENANRELGTNPRENLCQHCRDGRDRARLDRIIQDYGYIASQRVLLGIENNSIGDGYVDLICADCLRQVRALVDLSDILSRLREVI